MKIGIITYHRSHNYGALLQAVALRHVLCGMGNSVSFIDYWPSYHKRIYSLFSLNTLLSKKGLKGKIYYVMDVIIHFSSRYKRFSNFHSFIKAYIRPYFSSMKEPYDLVIYGSDQIWRKQPGINKYNPVYFGKNNIITRKHVSYAASMGPIPDNEEDIRELSQLLCNLDSVSTRERDLNIFVSGLGFASHQDIDPTLLITGREWRELVDLKRINYNRYALFYDLLPNSFDEEQMSIFCKKHNLMLLKIYGKAIEKDAYTELSHVGPQMFLSLINGASFVFTSSFHGLAFSILFEKPFFASFSVNSNRAESLLSAIGIEGKLIAPKSVIPLEYIPIDYNAVNDSLIRYRKESLNYLETITQQ